MSIKTDKEVKEDIQEFAREIGMPVSTIVNAYFKELLRTREVRYSVPPKMTPHLERVIAVARRDYKNKKNISPAFTNADDAIRWLHSK